MKSESSWCCLLIFLVLVGSVRWRVWMSSGLVSQGNRAVWPRSALNGVWVRCLLVSLNLPVHSDQFPPARSVQGVSFCSLPVSAHLSVAGSLSTLLVLGRSVFGGPSWQDEKNAAPAV